MRAAIFLQEGAEEALALKHKFLEAHYKPALALQASLEALLEDKGALVLEGILFPNRKFFLQISFLICLFGNRQMRLMQQ